MKMTVSKFLNVALVLLMVSVFVVRVTLSDIQGPILPYDPWSDINDDGKIDIKDVADVAGRYGTIGTAINKTALLLYLNETVRELQSEVAILRIDLDALNSTLTQQIEDLETKLAVLNATKLGIPDWDSFEVYGEWVNINQDDTLTFTHNLNTTNVLVYVIGKYSDFSSPYIHQINYGGDQDWPDHYGGAYWHDLTQTEIKVTRKGTDQPWEYIRVQMWKIPEP